MPPTRRLAIFPSPFSPWQTAHLAAKSGAPCAALPLPAGKPTPSGPMLMSQAAASASLIGLPRRGVSVASAGAAMAPAASSSRAARLRVNMFRLPLGVDCPGGDAVHVGEREGDHRRARARLAALGDEGGPRRLHIAR